MRRFNLCLWQILLPIISRHFIFIVNAHVLIRFSERKVDCQLLMTKAKDGGIVWCGTSGKVFRTGFPFHVDLPVHRLKKFVK